MIKIHHLLAIVAVAIANPICNDAGAQELQSILKVDQPILVDQGPIVFQDSVLEDAIAPGPELILQPQDSSFRLAPVMPPPSYIELPQTVHRHSEHFPTAPIVVCDDCQCRKCSCKPKRKVEATVCLVDLHGCDHEVCIEVPACCQHEAPKVSWKKRRILGRQVATLCWDCCDHEVKVVVTRRGKVRVHD